MSAPIAGPTAGTYLSPNWNPQAVITGPPTASGAKAAYDADRNQVVLFGGQLTASSDSSQTWLWANGAWSQATPAHSPNPVVQASMVWSPSLHAVVLFGGRNDATGSVTNALWKWDGSDWTVITPIGASAPSARSNASVVYDIQRDGLVVFGGQNATGGSFFDDTWLFKDNTWTQLSTASPGFRSSAQMAYSTSSSQIVLFGGLTASCASCASSASASGDTWILGPSGGWTQQPAQVGGPAARYAGMIAFHPGLDGVVMFGGLGTASNSLADTWAWNGSTWLKAGAISSPPSQFGSAVAATTAGQLVMVGGIGSGLAGTAGNTWTYDTNLPVVATTVTRDPNAPASPNLYTGDSVKTTLTAANTGKNAINGLSLTSALPPGTLSSAGSLLTWAGNTVQPCLPGAQLVCGLVQGLIVTLGALALPAASTEVGSFLATVIGSQRGCSLITVPALAASVFGQTQGYGADVTICGGGLGKEDWLSYDTTSIGQGGTANVNVANGNLVVQQQDSTQVTSHGDLGFTLNRAYNSQDNLAIPGPLGAGWQFDLGETGDAASGGLAIGGLQIPSLQSVLSPLSVAYVDRDGTRHVFTLRTVATQLAGGALNLPIDLHDLGSTVTSALAALLNPKLLSLDLNGTLNGVAYNTVCLDATYTPPPGVDMHLWRYIGINSSTCSTANIRSDAAANKAITLGWTAVRPDRVRYDFDYAGRITGMVDATGNKMAYSFDGQGRLTKMYSTACVPATTASSAGGPSCPGYSLAYRAQTVNGIDYTVIDETDPVGEVTTFLVTTGSQPQLKQVWNPDNPFSTVGDSTASLRYEYSTASTPCPGSGSGTITTGVLCSATDANGNTTAFAYTPAPVGPDRVLSVSDRRATAPGGSASGNRVRYTYHDTDNYTTADSATPDQLADVNLSGACNDQQKCSRIQRTTFAGIDDAGRVGEIDAGNAYGVLRHQTAYFWDGNAIPACRQPDNVVDNNLCQTIVRSKPSSAPFTVNGVTKTVDSGVTYADAATKYVYGDLGQLLSKSAIVDPSQPWTAANSSTTTWGSRTQYVATDGSITGYRDTVAGGGKVTSAGARSGYPAAVAEDTPRAYYRFGETAGATTLTDSSGNGYDGTYTSPTVPLGSPGAIAGNTAADEKGNFYAAGVSSVPGFATGGGQKSAFTVETWTKTTDTGLAYTVAYGPTGNTLMAVGRSYGGLPFIFMASDNANGKSINMVGTQSVSDGQWHQVVATYDGSGRASGAKLFIDGARIGTSIYSDALDGAFSTPASALFLGWNLSGAATSDATQIDDTSLYSEVLSPQTIAAHYGAGTGSTRDDYTTLYAVADQTQMLTPRGNVPGASWGDYLTSYRRDMPASDSIAAGNAPAPNTTADPTVCGDATRGNTGLLCETDEPASAGVAPRDCASPVGGAPNSPPTSDNYTWTCSSSTYDRFGQMTTLRSAKAHADNSPAVTRYTYYSDTGDCTADPGNCDLSGKVSAGGWLKAVTDVANESDIMAYDRGGNIARTWDRNATHNKDVNAAAWTSAANPPSDQYTEVNHANPVTSASLSVSRYDSLLASANGTVIGSGTNGSSELGNQTTTAAQDPTAANGLSHVVQIAQASTGGQTETKLSGAVTGAGAVYTWGANTQIPTKVAGLPSVVALAIGGSGHYLALDIDGNVWGWGTNNYGQAGDGTTTRITTPKKILSGVSSVAAGAYHSLAIKTDGSVWAWGRNSLGQLGLGNTTNQTSPTKLPSFTNALAASGGLFASYIIKTDGSVWSFGDNGSGALGIGSSDTGARSTPQRISALGPGTTAGQVRQVIGSYYGAAALMADGRVWAWGLNNVLQLGSNLGTSQTSPTLVPNVTGQVAIAGGWATYLTADRAGRVSVWGQTDQAQAGTGSSPGTTAPSLAGHTVTPYAAPWRYARASRDAVGNLTTMTTSANGTVIRMRPARGEAVYTTAYDVTMRYNENDQQTFTLNPADRDGVNAALTRYDTFGNATRVINPRGYATINLYDAVNRLIETRTTRGTTTNAPGTNCDAGNAASGDDWTSQQDGHVICTSSVTFDGNDNVIVSADQLRADTVTTYDGLGRPIGVSSPRYDGTYTVLRTVTNYDADGNAVDVCPPRQFDTAHESTTATCDSNSVFSTHNTFDVAGRLKVVTRYRSSEQLTTSNRYDADGNVVSTTDANGHETTNVYDLLDRRISQTVPRQGQLRQTTTWNYDASGNVTSIQAPNGLNVGSGMDGALVVDGSNGTGSDGVAHPRSNPFKVPDNARYSSVTLRNGAWLTTPINGNGVVFSATDEVKVCADCGIDVSGRGQAGGAAAAAAGGNTAGGTGAIDVFGGNGGRGGAGSTTSGAGGGGGGHNGPGTFGTTNGPTAGAAGGASGTPNFVDVGSVYLRGGGGGGGGGGQGAGAVPSGGGGAGGGFVHITATTITVDGSIDADGKPGANATGNQGGGGGGAGGGIWLAAGKVDVATAATLRVNGGAGGTAANGNKGGTGANGYLRVDADTGNPAASESTRNRVANTTAYSYDANNRIIDVVNGAQQLDAADNRNRPDRDGLYNQRTRTAYDADSNIVMTVPPQAFTTDKSDPNGLTKPNLDTAARTDYDLNGRPVVTYSPRYNGTVTDQGAGNDGGSGTNQQTAECPTGATPNAVPDMPSYGAGVGVCVLRARYDANGNVERQYLPGSTGTDNRYSATTYTDDDLVLTASTADPSGGTGQKTQVSYRYDGVGRMISQTDGNGVMTQVSYTADGLQAATAVDGYTRDVDNHTVTHIERYGYDANGQNTTYVAPNGEAPNNEGSTGRSAGDYTTKTEYTSDGLVREQQAPGLKDGDRNVTTYSYDKVGNPRTVTSPQSNAGSKMVTSSNTFTDDNLIKTSTELVKPADSGTLPTYRTTAYTYTPSGQKASAEMGRCLVGTPDECVPGDANSPWRGGRINRYTYAPTGLNIDQIGSDGATITTTYDQAGRPAKIADSKLDLAIQASYYLDGLPRRISESSGDNTLNTNTNTYAFNGSGALTYRTDTSDSAGITAGAAKATSYKYNDASVPTALRTDVNNGGTSTWAYDVGGRSTRQVDKNSAGTVERTVVRKYLRDNQLDYQNTYLGSGTPADPKRDDPSAHAANSYQYDNTGNITQYRRTSATSGNNITNGYSYNPANNLTMFTHAGKTNATVKYTWDHNANRLAAEGTDTKTWTYNADNSIRTYKPKASAAASDYVYNNAGELTDDECNTYQYDGFGRMRTQNQSGSAACGSTARTSTYSYDGLDRQRRVETTGPNGPKTQTAYDGLTTTMAGQTLAAYGQPASRPTILYEIGPSGEPIATKQSTASGGTPAYAYLNDDGAGNVSSVSDAGSTTASCVVSYDPFGDSAEATATNSSGPCMENNGTPNKTANVLWFRGANRDANTGSYQLGVRTYQPGKGSYTTPDSYRVGTPDLDLSVGTDPDTANTYSYVNGNPVNFADPDGHEPINESCRKGTAAGQRACNESYSGCQTDACKARQRATEAEAGQDAKEADQKAKETEGRKVVEKGVDWKAIAYDVLGEISGIKDIIKCAKNLGFNSDCAGAALGILGSIVGGGGFKFYKAAKRLVRAVGEVRKIIKDTEKFLSTVKSWRRANRAAREEIAGLRKRAEVAEQAAAKRATDEAKAAGRVSEGKRADTVEDAGKAKASTRRCETNSFPAETKVMLADGRTKAIGLIERGDRVLATDPETGINYSAPVAATYRNLDKALTELVVRDTTGNAVTVDTTQNHLFYEQRRGWVDARDLRAGDRLWTATGSAVSVLSVSNTVGAEIMRDITVAAVHTFYILAGSESILVHNCDSGEVDWGKQEKHFYGHNNYQGGSKLTSDPDKLARRAGTGQPVNKVPRGEPGYRERIDFEEPIGVYKAFPSGDEFETTVGILHYGKRGFHIVPARPIGG